MKKCFGGIKTVSTSEGSFCESGRMRKLDCIYIILGLFHIEQLSSGAAIQEFFGCIQALVPIGRFINNLMVNYPGICD